MRRSNAALVQIGLCYSSSEAALVVSALEGAGFDVLLPHFHTHALLPHQAIALGGMPLMVPRTQADEALAYLPALQASRHQETADTADTVPPQTLEKGFVRKIAALVLMLIGGVGLSLNATFLKRN